MAKNRAKNGIETPRKHRDAGVGNSYYYYYFFLTLGRYVPEGV